MLGGGDIQTLQHSKKKFLNFMPLQVVEMQKLSDFP